MGETYSKNFKITETTIEDVTFLEWKVNFGDGLHFKFYLGAQKQRSARG